MTPEEIKNKKLPYVLGKIEKGKQLMQLGKIEKGK